MKAYKRARTGWLNAPASDKEYYQELLNKATEEYTYWKDEVVAPAERKNPFSEKYNFFDVREYQVS